MLETQRNEALRRRFGLLADRACRTLDEKEGEPAPRKKGTEPERKALYGDRDLWFHLTMWSLINCQASHLTLN
jgi:hypothetical protein